MHNDAFYTLELRPHPDDAIGFEVVSFEPAPETPQLRHAIFLKALELAAKAARRAARDQP